MSQSFAEDFPSEPSRAQASLVTNSQSPMPRFQTPYDGTIHPSASPQPSANYLLKYAKYAKSQIAHSNHQGLSTIAALLCPNSAATLAPLLQIYERDRHLTNRQVQYHHQSSMWKLYCEQFEYYSFHLQILMQMKD